MLQIIGDFIRKTSLFFKKLTKTSKSGSTSHLKEAGTSPFTGNGFKKKTTFYKTVRTDSKSEEKSIHWLLDEFIPSYTLTRKF